MKLIVTTLGIVFLSVHVSSDDSNDETNINICLNINIGPGCAGGRCRRPPPSNNCNKNTTSGRSSVSHGAFGPDTVTERPRRISTDYPDGWANFTVFPCDEDKSICADRCREEGYTHHVCLFNGNMCHCYGHTKNGTQGAGWVDVPDPNCGNDECATKCHQKGFAHSICIGSTCHCYQPGPPQQQTTFVLTTDKPDYPDDWANFTVFPCDEDMSICVDHCRVEKYTHGVCLLDGNVCHCYSHTKNGTHGAGWVDVPDPNCGNEECATQCHDKGFTHSICTDKKCHCYQPGPPQQQTIFVPTTDKPDYPDDWANFTVFPCDEEKSICVDHCRVEGYTHGVCLLDGNVCHCYSHTKNGTHGPGWVDLPDPNCENEECANQCHDKGFTHCICIDEKCHCYQPGPPQQQTTLVPRTETSMPDYPDDWANFTVFPCDKDKSICADHCKVEGYTHSVCLLGGNICHCYSHTKNGTQGAGWVDVPDPNCEHDECATKCHQKGFAHSICIGSKCHCYQPGPPQQQTTFVPATDKPNYPDDWANFTVFPCDEDEGICADRCRKEAYTCHVCLLTGNMCHCYGHTKTGTQGAGWVDVPDPNCENEECATQCHGRGFTHSICIGKKCHCYQPGPPQQQTAFVPTMDKPDYPDDWANFTVFGCDEDKGICTDHCRVEGYTHSVCLLSGNMCHCYSHTKNGTYGPGWVDVPDPNCENEECATECHDKGFTHSICIGKKCHCYQPGPPQKQTTIVPATDKPGGESYVEISLHLCVNPKCRKLCGRLNMKQYHCKSKIRCRCTEPDYL